MRLPLRTQILAASAVIALIVGGVFAAMLFAIGDLRSSAEQARQSEEAVSASN